VSGQPYVLATACERPDREFATIAQLAGAIVGGVGEGARLALRPASVGRGELPHGAAVAVRHLDNSSERGSLVGYVFAPASCARDASDALARALIAAGAR
jgi:hypothetical protein